MYVNIDSVINNEPRLTDELVSENMWERWTDMDYELERRSTQTGSLTAGSLTTTISGLNQISGACTDKQEEGG